ncbi:MAG: cupin domain-containing protein [Kiloniellales bacterium]
MKYALPTLVLGVAALMGVALVASAQTMDDAKIVSPEQIEWGPGPASIPAGAEAVTLFGDPTKEELFAIRIKAPKDYHIPPHTHPKPEVVTVVSGALRLGMGETADRDKAELLSAGSFFALSPGMAHYVYTDEETVLQLNSVGPWALTYVNPKDDPRQGSQ